MKYLKLIIASVIVVMVLCGCGKSSPENDGQSRGNGNSILESSNEDNSSEAEHSDKSSESENLEETSPSDTESSLIQDWSSLHIEEKIEQMSNTEGKTEAQISAMQELSDGDNRFNYKRAVVTGVIDANAPKLTVEDVKRIIKEANDLYPYSDPPAELTLEEKWEYFSDALAKRYEYVIFEIQKIQPFPDETFSSTYENVYKPEYICTDKNTYKFYDGAIHERILVSSRPMTIYYEKFNDNQELISQEAIETELSHITEFREKYRAKN